jgi:histone acetyltransferase (RNA polymerase elongator complex component)
MKRLVVPVFLPQAGCPGRCSYCDQPSVSAQRGLPSDAEVRDRVDAYLATAASARHPFGEREIAFYGGSFTGLHPDEQARYLTLAAEYLADGRVQAVRVSTHPALVDPGAAARLAAAGVLTVELGAQSSDDAVLAAAGRACTWSHVRRAVDDLRGAGLRVGLHLMAGLPGASRDADVATARDAAALAPDAVRLHPTLVLRGTPLEDELRAGRYVPLSLDEALERCGAMLAVLHEAGVEVIRVGLHGADDLGDALVAGPVHPSFGYLATSRALALRIADRVEALGAEGAFEVLASERDRGAVLGPGRATWAGLEARFPRARLALSFGPDLKRGVLVVRSGAGSPRAE